MTIIISGRALEKKGDLPKEMLAGLLDETPTTSYILGSNSPIKTYAECIPDAKLNSMDKATSVLVTDSEGPFLKNGYTFIFPSHDPNIAPFTVPDTKIVIFYNFDSMFKALLTMRNI